MNMEEMKTLVNSGKMYDDANPHIAKARNEAIATCRTYNKKVNDSSDYDMKLLKGLFAEIGENVYLESNFRCEFGFNIYLGKNIYINHDMIILDCNEVTIGNDVYIGPRVGLYAANHAEDPIERANNGVYSKPIKIGDKVWIGGDVQVGQGVTIGENSIIGMGSVVTKDVPANVIAAGNPCRVIRQIKESETKWKKPTYN
ncbi:maltose O-acetyltransferase [Amphibacillus marinus]|uniref:Acetyltransferase n=1 Tax=Amphibacillus marinus TaxID=872970 RepID=A0A1H8RIC1_9BACI|nr:sugar O-acetyltransferase [Amphibacillus marinus]SEO65908.1 maltose O-acetyltransferase [Amphibacillus marinus]